MCSHEKLLVRTLFLTCVFQLTACGTGQTMQDGSGKSDTGFSTENVISFAGFTQALEKTYDVVETQGPDGTAGSEMPGAQCTGTKYSYATYFGS